MIEIEENLPKSPFDIVTERMKVLPENVLADGKTVAWLVYQAASIIDINECGGKGMKGAFGMHVARWIIVSLAGLNGMKVEEFPDYGRVEQIADSLVAFLDADVSKHLRPTGYEEHKESIRDLVKIVLADELK